MLIPLLYFSCIFHAIIKNVSVFQPENIMCHTRTSHQIKLIDFGLAQKISPDTPVRVLFGTPEFIPPEIINYEPIGVESDMWSVGVICYVL
jgi:myosin-light-chain kinase